VNEPIAPYENILSRAVTISEPAEALLDDDTTTRWTPEDLDSVSFEGLASTQVTHIGVSGHNLGSSGGELLIEGYDGSAWVAIDTITADNDQSVLREVVPSAVSGIRVTAIGEGIRVSILYVGQALEFERKFYQGHTPIRFSEENTLLVKSQGGGQFLGNRVDRRSASTTVSIKNLLPYFVRIKLEPFRQHYNNGGRFFFSWRPDKYPDEAVFAYGSGAMKPTNDGPAAYMSVDFQIVAYIQTEKTLFLGDI